MISAAAVPKVKLAGNTTPALFWLPSAVVKECEMQRPSKYTLALGFKLTLFKAGVVLMADQFIDSGLVGKANTW
jgi:hypothetical protein